MSANIEIKIDGTQVIGNLEAMVPRLRSGLNIVGHTVGKKMKSHAQHNAKWTDRTGAARGGLSFKSGWEGYVLDISIMHTVDYGLWLEVRNFPYAGRLAILEEARDSQVDAFINMIKKVLRI